MAPRCSSSRWARRRSPATSRRRSRSTTWSTRRQEGGFALINALDIAVNSDTQATLTAATKVLDPATTGLRELAAGTHRQCARAIRRAVAGWLGGPDRGRAPSSPRCSTCPRCSSRWRSPCCWCIGVSESATVNNIIVAIKVTVILAVHRGRRVLRQPRQLASVHSRAHGRREPVRHRRRDPRRDDRVLRLHRLRGGLDRGPGSEESAQGHAHRHPGLADHLHRPLHADRRGAHGRGVVHQAQRRGARRHRGRHLRAAVGLARQAASRSARSRACRRWCWC